MRVEQLVVAGGTSVEARLAAATLSPHLVLAFGHLSFFNAGLSSCLRQRFPGALLAGCSTAGEIGPEGVTDGELVLSLVQFDAPDLNAAHTELRDMQDSHAAGLRIGQSLTRAGLHDVLIFAPGVGINGSALIDGFRESLGKDVSLSGGLAGDSGAFSQTFTLSNAGVSASQVVAIGFSGAQHLLRHGSFHGWVPFGPERKVTRCDGNILYELDGEPALGVYKRYLGEYAKDLPASGLLFPFEMISSAHSGVGLIRTILGIDEAQGSLILAGDILPDGYLRLMHATTDSLVSGAETAAERTELDKNTGECLAVLVSCVGRKLVMGARVDEEIEAVTDIFGKHAKLAGFYSYGEISPIAEGLDCKLHNQTMTITTLSER